jgi:hypothetical protein
MSDTDGLARFVVAAKAATYVGGGEHATSSRPQSHDLRFVQDEWEYLDSYFGGTDFLGQEVVHRRGEPVWAMNYYGRILADERLDAATAGAVIKHSLSELYLEGRFLGGFETAVDGFRYVDTNSGDVSSFEGREWIEQDGVHLYELVYHGGLVRP